MFITTIFAEIVLNPNFWSCKPSKTIFPCFVFLQSRRVESCSLILKCQEESSSTQEKVPISDQGHDLTGTDNVAYQSIRIDEISTYIECVISRTMATCTYFEYKVHIYPMNISIYLRRLWPFNTDPEAQYSQSEFSWLKWATKTASIMRDSAWPWPQDNQMGLLNIN